MPIPICLDDYRTGARARLPAILFDYIDGGSARGVTQRRNSEDFDLLTLRQKVMSAKAPADTRTRLFDTDLGLPLLLAPVGMAGMFARRGEVQAARAVQKAGIGMILSTMSVCDVEEVSLQNEHSLWFQLYKFRDPMVDAELMQRAWAAGVRTLVFTVDVPVTGPRYREMRAGAAAHAGWRMAGRGRLQAITRPAWIYDLFVRGRPHRFGNLASRLPDAASLDDFWPWIRENLDPHMSWDDIARLRASWPGRIILKGVLDPADAATALDAGVDGLIVSNHGGRQLDGASSTIAALPPIVEALQGAIPVLLDGGVRSGTDLLKALALGASACLVGRPWAFALASDGERGVSGMIQILRNELMIAMTLCGIGSVDEITAEVIAGRTMP